MNNFISALEPDTILHGNAYNYKIDKALGQGSFGITYLAVVQMEGPLGTLNSKMQVAIKEFFMRNLNGRDGALVICDGDATLFDRYRRDFSRETTNLSKLNHPNIIKVMDKFDYNCTSYYVMEYINGTNLNTYIKENVRLSEYESLSCVEEIAKAVEYMHSKKMLHLDIKPMNVMRDLNGNLKLIDFGLSKQFNEDGEPESTTTIGAGTTGYAPLEQHSYRRGQGFPATLDIYALGGTLYKCLTGEAPPESSFVFNEGLPIDKLKSYGISEATIRLIKQAMEPKVKMRIQSSSEFLAKLRSILPTACRDKPKKQVNPDTNRLNILQQNRFDYINYIKKNFNISGETVRGYNIIWKNSEGDALDEGRKSIIRDFINQMKSTSEKNLISYVPSKLYGVQHDATSYPDKKDVMKMRLPSFKMTKFILRLEQFTSCQWRFPSIEEVEEFVHRRKGLSKIFKNFSGEKILCYDSQDVSFHVFDIKKGDIGRITNDFNDYTAVIVLDKDNEYSYQTPEEQLFFPEKNTRVMINKKGPWQFGFCPYEVNGKWSLINVNFDDHFPNDCDEAPQVGFMSYPIGGPVRFPEMMVKYRKGNREGYFRVIANHRLIFEIELSDSEWEERAYWT